MRKQVGSYLRNSFYIIINIIFYLIAYYIIDEVIDW
jgi:hypothetical protein